MKSSLRSTTFLLVVLIALLLSSCSGLPISLPAVPTSENLPQPQPNQAPNHSPRSQSFCRAPFWNGPISSVKNTAPLATLAASPA